jgi:hypothetical protein
MFASQVGDYLDDNELGTTRTHATDSFDPTHPVYRDIKRLAALTKAHPALRNGAMQDRWSSGSSGIYAFSRLARQSQREYVVALNNSTTARTAAVPTYVRRGGFTRVYGDGPRRLSTDRSRRLRVTVPALSTVVYESTRRIPASRRAPSIGLVQPRPPAATPSRMRVQALVGGASFNEVTFYAKAGRGAWRPIGTDDSRPYRVFHDTSRLDDGTPVRYRAVVRDNAGHTRLSGRRTAVVPKPRLTFLSPAPGADVFGTIHVDMKADPERASHVVTVQRKVGSGSWRTLRVDRSSPAYGVFDDVSAIPVGTTISYRGILTEPDGTRVVGPVRTVTRTAPKPLVTSATVAGSMQSEAGCTGDWQPDCATTHLTFDTGDGLWKGTWTLPAGDYEWKIAIDDSWTTSYGDGGGGSNIALHVPTGGAPVTFVWDQVSHVPTATVGSGG